MTEQEMSLIAVKIAGDIQFWIACVGLIGVVIGSILTVLGNFAIEWFKTSSQRKADKLRQKLLKEMLQDQSYPWRNLSTLSAVIGCSEEQTKNHLIFIGARGSESKNGSWGLLSRHPLPIRDN